MSEQVKPEEFYQEHRKVTGDLEEAKLSHKFHDEKATELEGKEDYPPFEYASIEAPKWRKAANNLGQEVEKLSDKRDANLWRASQDYKAHEGEYHEQAVEDAESAGVEVKVEKPKDN